MTQISTRITTVPDALGSAFGVLEVKNAKNVSFTKQLRAQHAAAESGGAAFNLLISPRTQTVSGPLLTAIERTGGKIFMFDPTTGKFFDVVTDGNKVRPPQ